MQKQANPCVMIGIGGFGCTIADEMLTRQPSGQYLGIDTDATSLNSRSLANRVLIGQRATKHKGTGKNRATGYQSAVESSEQILQAIGNATTLIIFASANGGTGAGVAHWLTQTARSTGLTTIILTCLPLEAEGEQSLNQAKGYLDELKDDADLLVVFPWADMLKCSPPDTKLKTALQRGYDDICSTALTISGHLADYAGNTSMASLSSSRLIPMLCEAGFMKTTANTLMLAEPFTTRFSYPARQRSPEKSFLRKILGRLFGRL